jgi:hypothetical protein
VYLLVLEQVAIQGAQTLFLPQLLLLAVVVVVVASVFLTLLLVVLVVVLVFRAEALAQERLTKDLRVLMVAVAHLKQDKV